MLADHSSVTTPSVIDVNTESLAAGLTIFDKSSVCLIARYPLELNGVVRDVVVKPSLPKHKNTTVTHSLLVSP